MRKENKMDASTRLKVLADIEKYEALGEFDRHIDPIDESLCLPVDENFPYIPRGFLRARYAVERFIYVKPFIKRANRDILGTAVLGKENLRELHSAIVTCNHVNKFDCLALMHALSPKRLYVIGAKFNNMSGLMGEAMRAGGMLPLSDNMTAMKNLSRAVSLRLSEGSFVACYPEQAMWWNYEKPRPFKDGAFSMAVINNVPVLPVFITFRPTGELDSNGIEIKHMSVHIMPPIYPDISLPRRERVNALREQNARMCREKYEEIYGKPLKYTTKQTD